MNESIKLSFAPDLVQPFPLTLRRPVIHVPAGLLHRPVVRVEVGGFGCFAGLDGHGTRSPASSFSRRVNCSGKVAQALNSASASRQPKPHLC